MSCDPLVTVSAVTKTFRMFDSPGAQLSSALFSSTGGRAFCALDSVDLTLNKGEALGIVGRNGAGKSTLLQIICGTMAPTAGSVSVNGRIAAMLELGAGFHPDFTGRENARFAAATMGLGERQIDAVMPDIEEFAGIGSFIERPVREYSSGMFARLAFAVNANSNADILVVDEILGVGDARFQQKCLRHMRSHLEHGALIFVSHNEAAVLALCSRAIWLDGGKVAARGPARQVMQQYARFLSAKGDPDGLFQSGGTWDAGNTSAEPDADSVTVSPFDIDAGREARAVIDEAVLSHHRPMPAPGGDKSQEKSNPVFRGGEIVLLETTIRALHPIGSAVIAYGVRDGLGQVVFGDDTEGCSSDERSLKAGEKLDAHFSFRLPYLPSGDYTVDILVLNHKDRSIAAHAEASAVFSVFSTHISHGIANVKMRETRYQRLEGTSQ